MFENDGEHEAKWFIVSKDGLEFNGLWRLSESEGTLSPKDLAEVTVTFPKI